MKYSLTFLLAMLLPGLASSDSLDNITWMSEQYPPYNYVDEDGTPKGVTFDVLFKMFERVGHSLPPSEIDFLPWARSYRTLQDEPNTALFSMTYTDERQKLFKFVGPIIPSKVAVISRKDRNLDINSAKDLNNLKIGAIRDDIGEQMLLSLGVNKSAINQSSNTENMLKMLQHGRVDAVAYGFDIVLWNLKKMGEDPNNYEVTYTLKEGEMGYAFHKDVDPAVLEKLQKALDELKADGTVEQISAKYLK